MARKEGSVAEPETETAAPAGGTTAPAPIRSTQRYHRTDKVLEKELRGQAKETMDALNAAGDASLTAAEVAARCKYEGSRQEKERVAGFYLSQFKKKGLVTVSTDAPAPTNA